MIKGIREPQFSKKCRINNIISLIIIILVITFSLSVYLFDNKSRESKTESDKIERNKIIMDPVLKNCKPGILAEKMMQIIHGTSINKEDNYFEDWMDGEAWKNLENIAGLDQYYYYAVDAQYYDHMNEYTPSILIEGNSTFGCVHLEYTDWNAEGSSIPQENSEEMKSYALSIIESLGLTIDESDKIYIQDLGDNKLWGISGFQSINGELIYTGGIGQSEGLDATIHSGKEVRYFSILYWIDKSQFINILTRDEVKSTALEYLEDNYEDEDYADFKLIDVLFIRDLNLYYKGRYYFLQNGYSYYRTIHIDAINGIILSDEMN
jgi:hypothetical protein